MATPITQGFSNFFAVKDIRKFQEAISGLNGLDSVEINADMKVRLSTDTDWQLYPADGDTDEFVDLSEFMKDHLPEGEVAIFTWISQERASLAGGIVAVNNEGETFSQTLSELSNHAVAVLGLPQEGSLLHQMDQTIPT